MYKRKQLFFFLFCLVVSFFFRDVCSENLKLFSEKFDQELPAFNCTVNPEYPYQFATITSQYTAKVFSLFPQKTFNLFADPYRSKRSFSRISWGSGGNDKDGFIAVGLSDRSDDVGFIFNEKTGKKISVLKENEHSFYRYKKFNSCVRAFAWNFEHKKLAVSIDGKILIYDFKFGFKREMTPSCVCRVSDYEDDWFSNLMWLGKRLFAFSQETKRVYGWFIYSNEPWYGDHNAKKGQREFCIDISHLYSTDCVFKFNPVDGSQFCIVNKLSGEHFLYECCNEKLKVIGTFSCDGVVDCAWQPGTTVFACLLFDGTCLLIDGQQDEVIDSFSPIDGKAKEVVSIEFARYCKNVFVIKSQDKQNKQIKQMESCYYLEAFNIRSFSG